MSLLSGLYVGTTALRTASDALNTTSHNISNADTPGYTRQQVSQATRSFITISDASTKVAAKQTGLGVQYAETRQVRSYFLDQNYRRESGRTAFYEVSYEALVHMQDLLSESGEKNFGEAIEEFWESIQELADDPSSAVTQGLFISKAQTMLERANNVYKSMQDYQRNLNDDVKKYVNQLNDYGKRLVELNKKVVAIESGGVEHPNDLRDERNYILDQMAGLASISYTEDVDGFVSVQIEGVDFVKRNIFYEMALYENESGFVTPFWPHIVESSINERGERYYTAEAARQGRVFNLEKEISTASNTDIGRLKAILLARGDHSADSSDMYPADEYNKKIAPSICMNIQAEFDKLISNIAIELNDVLKDVVQNALKDFSDDYSDMSKDRALFSRIDVWDSYGPRDGWHIGNIAINKIFLQQPALLGFMTPDGKEDRATTDALKTAFEKEDYTLNPNTEKRSSFKGFYNDFIGQVANTGSVTKLLYEYQQDMQEEVSYAREQIHGVSTDEELQFMIKFQNAYNAASRYITTVNSMLESMLAQFGA